MEKKKRNKLLFRDHTDMKKNWGERSSTDRRDGTHGFGDWKKLDDENLINGLREKS